MAGDLPEFYFRVRDGGATVFRVDTSNRHRRIEMDQIASVSIRSGDIRPAGDRTLSTEEEDAKKLAHHRVDMVYVPGPEEIYPEGFATTVSVSGLTDVLCGAHRPGHFDGVATVVTKLFTQTRADQAFFGEKDFQQLQVVTRMAADLDLMTQVVGCPTIREEDGLAMSSRNLLLSDRARIKAPVLNEAMEEMAEGLRAGGEAHELRVETRKKILAAGFTEVEYLDLRACDDLSVLDTPTRPARLLAAAWLAGVRLIDNIAV